MSEQVFSIDELKRRFHISDKNIRVSGLTVDEYEKIYDDYENNRKNEIENIRQKFLSEFLFHAVPGIHSVASRRKDAYHLIEKIIRKKSNNDLKYQELSADNYYKFITDLIGVRLLIVYKSDWVGIHRYLMSKFENDEAHYLNDKNYLSSFDEDVTHSYIAEQPKVYIRPGDDEHFYKGISGIKLDSEKGYYRSIHYIIKYSGYYVEVQVRSIFEEGWGEVDHDVLYPLYKDSHYLVQYSMLLNRLAGLADEMSDYFKHEVRKDSDGKYFSGDVPISHPIVSSTENQTAVISATVVPNPSGDKKTLKDVENEVLRQ